MAPAPQNFNLEATFFTVPTPGILSTNSPGLGIRPFIFSTILGIQFKGFIISITLTTFFRIVSILSNILITFSLIRPTRVLALSHNPVKKSFIVDILVVTHSLAPSHIPIKISFTFCAIPTTLSLINITPVTKLDSQVLNASIIHCFAVVNQFITVSFKVVKKSLIF